MGVNTTVASQSASAAHGASRTLSLAWFPVSYALHVAEEAWAGESFPAWASRLSGVSFSRDEFVVLNAVAFTVMCVVVAAAWVWPAARRTAVPALGTIVAANGTLHAVASMWTWTYSPGVVSGVLVWLPLGVQTLRWAVQNYSARKVLAGSALGLAAHGAVSAVAFLH